MYKLLLIITIPLLIASCATQEKVATVCPPVTVEHLGQIPESPPKTIYKTKYIYIKEQTPPTTTPQQPVKEPSKIERIKHKIHKWWEKHHWQKAN